MSKFQSVVSTVAALTSIFGVGAAGYKLAQVQPDYNSKESPSALEQKITQLEQKLEEKLTTPLQMPPQAAPVAPTLPQAPTPPTPPLPPPLPPVETP